MSQLPLTDRPKANVRPELLAPAGGRAQFFAALNSGADAIYLGLTKFNARARAENFTPEEVYELTSLAASFDVKVLVTLNILIKENELSAIARTLAALALCPIYALIIQDLGLLYFIKKHFPHFRVHASTQLAIHNFEGVKKAWECGFSRVVLARELTFLEIKKITRGLKEANIPIEIEAFCHGSLCYSYSGLCFFSGTDDARSGNRGECAYTCRKPYKITSESGNGFLFSMKDLNTLDHIKDLADAGVHTLKIEGRKKDAQYVMSATRAYVQELDKHFGKKDSRWALSQLGALDESPRQDLRYSYSREFTRLFYQQRYDENVIDLDNPTHKGVEVGVITKVNGPWIELTTREPLERYDGIRIGVPQDAKNVKTLKMAQQKYGKEQNEFSLRRMKKLGQLCTKVEAGENVAIEIPPSIPLSATELIGGVVVKTRSNELKRRTDEVSQNTFDQRLQPWRCLDLEINSLTIGNAQLNLQFVASVNQNKLFEKVYHFPLIEAKSESLTDILGEMFSSFGTTNIKTSLTCQLYRDHEVCFIPKSQLKTCKRDFEVGLQNALNYYLEHPLSDVDFVPSGKRVSDVGVDRDNEKVSVFSVKIDRSYLLNAAHSFIKDQKYKTQIVFEPKRAYTNLLEIDKLLDQLGHAKSDGIPIVLSLPMVFRAWDVPYHRTWINKALEKGFCDFEVGNLGALRLLEELAGPGSSLKINSDFSLYALNHFATEFLSSVLKLEKICLSIEDDASNLESQLHYFLSSRGPGKVNEHQIEVILYKDSPLFIAEGCTLTALHKGCPGPAVCGYRTLEIENDKGEQFLVNHENCRSFVLSKNAYSLSGHRSRLESLGIRNFRVDFLTRNYDETSMLEILRHCFCDERIPATHSANFLKTLL